MNNYASKELIERAVALMGRTVTYKTTVQYMDDIEDLTRDLAKATPLPYLVPRDEIDAICDLARCAPRPEPEPQPLGNPLELPIGQAPFGSSDARAWADYYLQYWPNGCADRDTMVGWFANSMMAKHDEMLASGDYVEANDTSDPSPEPRPSSKLLTESKKVAEWLSILLYTPHRRTVHVAFGRQFIEPLLAAIEAEEAQGSARDHNINAIYVARDQRDAAMKEAEKLRKERDEALSRAEKAEAALAVSTPPQSNHTRDDSRLAAFLRNYDSKEPRTFERMDEAALAELCRRALRER